MIFYLLKKIKAESGLMGLYLYRNLEIQLQKGLGPIVSELMQLAL